MSLKTSHKIIGALAISLGCLASEASFGWIGAYVGPIGAGIGPTPYYSGYYGYRSYPRYRYYTYPAYGYSYRYYPRHYRYRVVNCTWIPGHYNRYGHYVHGHRAC